MAALTQLTLDADGTIGANVVHNAGTGTPFVGHCNDAPDGLSSDWVANDVTETDTTAWFSLDDVDADFGSMDTLNIDVDVDAVDDGSSDDACTLTARIFDADNDISNPLTDETASLGTEADTARTQRNVSFAGLTGSKAQWDAAHIRFTWDYTKTGGPDNVQVRLYGLDIDGTYTAPSKAAGEYTVLGPAGYPRPPYGSFAGKSVAGGGGNALLLINPPGLDGGMGASL